MRQTPKGLRSLHFSFGDASRTRYGGMALSRQFCRKLGLKRLFQTHIPWSRRDNRCHPAELLLCILYGSDSHPTRLCAASCAVSDPVGYNPKKPRRPSYHPIVAFDGRTQDTLHGILRPGDTRPATIAQEMFRICRSKVPRYVHRKRVAVRLRADAGFYDKGFAQLLDQEKADYCIVARMTHPLQERAAGLRFRAFRRQGRRQAAQTVYQPMHWDHPHRFIMVRRPKPPREEEAGQLTLRGFQDFFYHTVFSNLSLTPAAVCRFYADRANIELDIRELKEALPLGKIPAARFIANAAHFEMILLAHDLVNWFRRLCLPKPWQRARLQTLRHELFILPARLLNIHHRNVLALPSEYPHRRRFFKALAQIRRLRIP